MSSRSWGFRWHQKRCFFLLGFDYLSGSKVDISAGGIGGSVIVLRRRGRRPPQGHGLHHLRKSVHLSQGRHDLRQCRRRCRSRRSSRSQLVVKQPVKFLEHFKHISIKYDMYKKRRGNVIFLTLALSKSFIPEISHPHAGNAG